MILVLFSVVAPSSSLRCPSIHWSFVDISLSFAVVAVRFNLRCLSIKSRFADASRIFFNDGSEFALEFGMPGN